MFPCRTTAPFVQLLTLLVCVGCGKPTVDDRYERPKDVHSFAVLYDQNCSGCHGSDGRFGPGPPLNDPLLMAIISDEQMTNVVRSGRAGTLMPAFARSQGGALTEQQIEIIVDGLRRRWAKAGSVSTADLPAYQVAPGDPAGLAHADAKDGEKLFANVCSNCHGIIGQGTTMAGALRERALTELLSDQLLRRIIITGRADLGMPNYVDSGTYSSIGHPLTSDEIINLAAYVRSLQNGDRKAEVAAAAE